MSAGQTMNGWHPNKIRIFRGLVLSALYSRHNVQGRRMDDVELTHTLWSMASQATLNDVLTILQEMQGRGWVSFSQFRNRLTDRIELSHIEILHPGRDLVEGTANNAAVLF